jgi:hypothetical protein
VLACIYKTSIRKVYEHVYLIMCIRAYGPTVSGRDKRIPKTLDRCRYTDPPCTLAEGATLQQLETKATCQSLSQGGEIPYQDQIHRRNLQCVNTNTMPYPFFFFFFWVEVRGEGVSPGVSRLTLLLASCLTAGLKLC